MGGIYHAMSRGNNGERIFLDDTDYGEFLGILHRGKRRFRFQLYAYCLMPNHFHLLLQRGPVSISQIMHWILTCYAHSFNRRKDRRGHLFQGRFLAPLCVDDCYFLQLLRYIHLNPVRSGLTVAPGQWCWSGHHELVGIRKGGLLDSAFALSLFHAERTRAIALYEKHLDCSEDEIRKTSALVKSMHDDPTAILPAEEAGICGDEPQDAGLTLEQVAAHVCQERNLGVSVLQGSSRSRAISQARRLLVCRAAAAGVRPIDIAAFLRCLPSSISNILSRWDEDVKFVKA